VDTGQCGQLSSLMSDVSSQWVLNVDCRDSATPVDSRQVLDRQVV